LSFSILNNWVGFLSSLGFTLGFFWGGIRIAQRLIARNERKKQRLGDISARTETKVDNLMGFMERYAEKVDYMGEKLERHLGQHEGIE